MNIDERKRRFAKLLQWLLGDKPQAELSRATKISQSAMSGFINPKEGTPYPAHGTKLHLVEYLQANRDRKWSLHELENYLDASESIESFAGKLSKKQIPEERLTLSDRIAMMDTQELLNVNVMVADRLKKICFATA